MLIRQKLGAYSIFYGAFIYLGLLKLCNTKRVFRKFGRVSLY